MTENSAYITHWKNGLFFGESAPMIDELKYLEVVYDRKLRFNKHKEFKVKQAIIAF